ncbi:AIPR family protein [Sphingomonas sp. DC2300-3]|uniref:AIPR family protein n=1 Tax=unclassified Sphingomonas TaxID=196159 RepID=UPI003CF3B6EE
MHYIDVLSSNTEMVERLGIDGAHLAWVMAQYLEEGDPEALAAIALTDGPDDKKIDFIFLDHDSKRLVFAQGFYAVKPRDSAPANKASDLNTAAAWLISGDTSQVPKNLKDMFENARAALAADEIDTVELIYVHNLPESVNTARELQTAEEHMRKALGSASIVVRAVELGSSQIQHLHDAQDSHIDVKDDVHFPSPFLLEEKGPTWNAYVASVPGMWLHNVYAKYSDRLFSANYRGFLGGGRRKRVNAGIISSAESRPEDFWAYNNGITILTMAVKNRKDGQATLAGLSIINGAQTTGSVASVDILKKRFGNLRVLCRVIESSDAATIADIVRFNNTQNAITNWDQYSNDPDQKRIASEFAELGFKYNIKRGFLGQGEQIGVDEVIQPLLAFHGRPQDAVRGKGQIFDRKPLYQNAFDGKKARHVLFVYTLSKAIDNWRLVLKAKSNAGSLIGIESDQLDLMRNLRFKSFFLALMASTVETALGKRCDPQTVGFQPDFAKRHTIVELTARWSPLVETLLALVTASAEARNFASRMSDEKFMAELTKQMNALLYAMGAAGKHATFAEHVTGV